MLQGSNKMKRGSFMYCQLKDDFASRLVSVQIPNETIKVVSKQLDLSAYDYDIAKKETDVIPYGYEIPELVKRYLITGSIEGLSEGTLYNYKRFLEIFFNSVQKQPEEVNVDDITFFLYWYKRRNPDKLISDRSLDKVLCCLKTFFRWAYKRQYISFDPTASLKPIKCEKKVQDHLTEVELEQVRRACENPKETALVEFLYCTGCRVSEAANVKLSDINWDERTVVIFGKGKKWGTGFLSIRACFVLQDYIANYRKGNSEYLFASDRRPYGQLHKDGIEKIIRNIKNRSGINKNLTPHVFRRTMATLMLDKGASIQDIQKILRHDKIETTLKYAKVNMKHVQESHRKYVS